MSNTQIHFGLSTSGNVVLRPVKLTVVEGKPAPARRPSALSARRMERSLAPNIEFNSATSLDPAFTRKGKLAHPGSLIFSAGATLYTAYIFNFGGAATFLDHLLGGWNGSVQARSAAIASVYLKALPVLGILVAAAAVYASFLSLGRWTKRMKKARLLATREPLTLQQFADSARHHGVSGLVARETYRLLKPVYGGSMRALLADRLSSELNLTATAIADLLGNLLYQTDRRPGQSTSSAPIETVLDLLKVVQQTQHRHA